MFFPTATPLNLTASHKAVNSFIFGAIAGYGVRQIVVHESNLVARFGLSPLVYFDFLRMDKTGLKKRKRQWEIG